MGFPGGSVAKNKPANTGDVGPIPGSGRSPGEGSGKPHQYCCLENSTDNGTWWAKSAAAAKSLQLCLTLCDPIDGSPPGSAVPGLLSLWGLKSVGHNLVTRQQRTVASNLAVKNGRKCDDFKNWFYKHCFHEDARKETTQNGLTTKEN